jgi:signal transduction histidine kinase
MERLERLAVVLAVLLLVVLPTVLKGWPDTVVGNLAVLSLAAGGLALAWWRTHPRVASVAALVLVLLAAAVGPQWLPDPSAVLLSGACAVLALGWSGRAAWVAGACGAAYLGPLYVLTDIGSWVAALMLTVPPYVAGTVLRLRRETADQLAERARELEEERELVTEIALRHERARIASELHDIVGHAISVMVVQAAAGQRLVDSDPVQAQEALVAISESARQGTRDLERLVELLGGDPGDPGGADGRGAGDLVLVQEVVGRAVRSGLDVSCRFEGDPDGLGEAASHLAFRVVQESLTNALRHAPGSQVRVLVRTLSVGDGADLDVRVENDASAARVPTLVGTGRGLTGLRERLHALGGDLDAGATPSGGWAVHARIPALATLPRGA